MKKLIDEIDFEFDHNNPFENLTREQVLQIRSRRYDEAPKMDHRGDLTDEFMRWLAKADPEAFVVRYYGRLEQPVLLGLLKEANAPAAAAAPAVVAAPADSAPVVVPPAAVLPAGPASEQQTQATPPSAPAGG